MNVVQFVAVVIMMLGLAYGTHLGIQDRRYTGFARLINIAWCAAIGFGGACIAIALMLLLTAATSLTWQFLGAFPSYLKDL